MKIRKFIRYSENTLIRSYKGNVKMSTKPLKYSDVMSN